MRFGIVSFIALGLLLQGCSALRAGPAEPAGFIENPEDLKEMREHAPFHGL